MFEIPRVFLLGRVCISRPGVPALRPSVRGGIFEGPGHPPPGSSFFSRTGALQPPRGSLSWVPGMGNKQQRRSADLPPPGDPADALAAEEQLLRDYALTRDENAREELVRRFLPFARSLAMRYSGGVEPSEDLFQV